MLLFQTRKFYTRWLRPSGNRFRTEALPRILNLVHFFKLKKRNIMPQLNNVLDILKLLDKSNCKKCGEATCMAFAASVHKGENELKACPNLEDDVIKMFGDGVQKRKDPDEDTLEAMDRLKREVAETDLDQAAIRAGGKFRDNRLTLKILGKDFSVDTDGNLFSDIHINPWVAGPFLRYVLHAKGTVPSGNWIPFRELKGGKEWQGLFGQQCEKPIKSLADKYSGLFEDILNIFSGRQVDRHYASDISLVLHPLPKVPVLICYWKPEDGMDSDLKLFFDATTEDNLSIESVYTLCTGMAKMFEKIVRNHV
ncbi:putative Fe-S cluster [delta proteobacterium NaphS2]|nr:putative Fe-S cluster [delta proteobacterium NaphS2]